MSITIIIVIVTCVVSFVAFNNPYRMQQLLFIPVDIIHRKQWYRMISSGFIHADFNHLLWNMISFFSFGSLVEAYFNELFQQYSGVVYILFYLSAIVISSIPDLIRHRNDKYYSALGASGAVCAVIFAAILFQPTSTIYFMMIIPIPAFLFGIIFILLSSYLDKINFGNIGHLAHLSGAIYGFIFPLLFYPSFLSDFFNQIKHTIG